MERQQHLGVGVCGHQFLPHATARIVDGGRIVGEHTVPVVLAARRAVGHLAPEIEMALVGLVHDHFLHVVGRQAEPVQRGKGRPRASAAETGPDQFERHFPIPRTCFLRYPSP